MSNGKYYKITYEGALIMEIFAYSSRQAKERAKDTLMSGNMRQGRNLARLEAL